MPHSPDLRHLIHEEQDDDEKEKHNGSRAGGALEIENRVRAQEAAVHEMEGFHVVVPNSSYPAARRPVPAALAILINQENGKAGQISKLEDEIHPRIDALERHRVEQEAADKNDGVLVALDEGKPVPDIKFRSRRGDGGEDLFHN